MQRFDHTIDYWIDALDQYNQTQLSTKPSAESWSLGQLYLHLINDTKFYIEQIRTCLHTNENSTGQMMPFAKSIFQQNGFPDEVIQGAPSNATIPQPENKIQLVLSLQKLKDEMHILTEQMATTPFTGKTKHPGLGYFSAGEWYQFAEMHFRHHLRQKNRLDNFLGSRKF